MRICSFLPSGTEMLYAIGAGRFVVGRSEHCTYPPSVRRKPVLVKSRVKKIAQQDSHSIHQAVLRLKRNNGHQFDVDARLLKRLQPDLVVSQTLCNVCAASHTEVEEALAQLHPRPRLVHLKARTLAEVFEDLRTLGEATGRQAAAARRIRTLERQLAQIGQRMRAARTTPRVWCCEWLEPLMAAGHWVPELVERAGGQDGLGKKGANSRWISWDEVRAYDPEIILVMPCSYSIPQSLRERSRLTGRPGWERLSAVRSGRTFAIDSRFSHHAGPRLLEGLRMFAHLIHPELKWPWGASLRNRYRKLEVRS